MQRRGLNRASCGSRTPLHVMFCFFRARRAASKAMRRSRSARIGAISSNVEAPLATSPRRLNAYLLGFAPVRDHHVIEKQPAITVRRLVSQRAHMLIEHAYVLALGDRLRPVRKRLDLPDVRAHSRTVRELGKGRKRSF
jgi:hypothetical protein